MPEDPPPPPQPAKISRADAEKIRAARLAAVVRKVKEGKSLTLGEQRLLDSMTEADAGDEANWPQWCTSQRQAAKLIGVPLAVVKAAKLDPRCSAFKDFRVNPRVLAAFVRAQKTALHTEQAAGVAGVAAPAPTPGAEPVKRTLAAEIDDMSSVLAQVDTLAKTAFARGDIERGLALLDQTKGIWERRKAAQVELRRQGKTEEDVLPRSEVERILHAVAHHLAVGLQAVAVDAVRAIEGETDPARQLPLVEGALVPAVLVAPLQQAAKLAASHGLPPWAVEAAEKALREVAR